MILNKGLWFGKGTVLVERASLGETVELDIEVVEDKEGYTISGRLLEGYSVGPSIFLREDLNEVMQSGRSTWTRLRNRISELLSLNDHLI